MVPLWHKQVCSMLIYSVKNFPSHDLISNSNHCKQIISPQSEKGLTTDSDQLKQAQLCILAPRSPTAQPKLISIRTVAGRANHTSLLK